MEFVAQDDGGVEDFQPRKPTIVTVVGGEVVGQLPTLGRPRRLKSSRAVPFFDPRRLFTVVPTVARSGVDSFSIGRSFCTVRCALGRSGKAVGDGNVARVHLDVPSGLSAQ